ncbi:MAG: tRNA (adenosine(37)-N6)-threonylcarbamoyltransferase complex dimerization subunit type 1 TsaB [Clostridia bacterium]|nr:tRNA (adenosine(37)-N6)-threonylcarbamoyltransferase complex dimerization subunit type 1 TsaB [Clostridia bacterium]
MKILGIDTSSNILSITVSEDKNILGESYIKNVNNHSPKLVPMVDQLLKNLEIDIKEIDLYACSIGPGSFTGLRIGLAFMKSLAQANDKPIIGVETLHSLALNNIKDVYTCPIIDAKNNNVYSCIFDENFHLVINYAAFNIEELLKVCKKIKKTIYFIEDNTLKYKDLIEKYISKRKIYNIESTYLTSKNTCIIAYEKYINKNIDNSLTLSPLYLKSSQAERLSKNGK